MMPSSVPWPADLRPGKIVAVHLSYASRAAERGRTPAHPSYFLKPASSVALGPATVVERPAGSELLGFEGEIALVIGTTARRVSLADAWAHVGHVTAANDLGVYDLRYADSGSNVRSKGGDGFTPLGPALIPAAGVDPAGLRIRVWRNGERVQEDTTAGMIFPLARLVADLSQLLTLEPGDVILTGTPAGASVAVPGDTVEVEVDVPGGPTSGRLATTVAEGPGLDPELGAMPRADDAQRIDAWGSRAKAGLPAPFELTPELTAKLAGVSTATLTTQLRKRGYDDAVIQGVLPTRAGIRVVGRARTLRYVPYRADLAAERGSGYTPQKRIFDDLGPGDVLVMESRGEAGAGTVGDILALRAQHLGAVAVVTDGGIRDYEAVAALDMPTFGAVRHPSVLGRRHVPWETDVVIACGGASVRPGDVVVGDGDGVVVIPPAIAAEVAAAAAEQEREEAFIAQMVAEGHPVDGLYPLGEEWKARYRAWTPE